MLLQEFESRLGRQLKDNENFNTIHEIYLASSLDKDAFVEEWKKKDHGSLLQDIAEQWERTQARLEDEKRHTEIVYQTHCEEKKREGYLWAEEAHEMSSTRARNRAIEILGLKGYLAYVISKDWGLWEIDRNDLINIISK